jgi:7-cyano-7-deazaguanine synthase
MATNHDLVILLSGGLDSTLLAHFAIKGGWSPIALLIEYGQRHVRELEAAERLCKRLKMPYRQMLVDLGEVDSALTGSGTEGLYRGVSQYHVPGRNTIFVGLAISLAEQVGARKVWYGANGEDRVNLFADCTQEYIFAMNSALARAASYPIELEAPLLGMRKTTIEAWANMLGIKAEDVHSGYTV